MRKTIIIYESKYGSTKEMAKIMALILGPANYCTTEEFKEEFKDFDFFILGSPIYQECIDERILRFVVDNLSWLKDKKIFLFCNCLSGKKGVDYLDELEELLGNNILYKKALNGKVILKSLDKADFKSIKYFLEKLNYPMSDMNMFDRNQIIEYSLKVKEIKERLSKPMSKSELKKYIEKFLRDHNTCTFSTGNDRSVRGTPIEYVYNNDCVYFFTEGGEKFANLLENCNVSLSIYNSFQGMNNLAGMQISGKAEYIEYKSKKYIEAIKLKDLKPEKITLLPIIMNVLKIKLNKVEFIHHKFLEKGYDIKQLYYFEDALKQS